MKKSTRQMTLLVMSVASLLAAIASGPSAALAGSAEAITPQPAKTSAPAEVARYDHVFVIIEENHGFSEIIGNLAAPNLNALAQTYGLATDSTSTGDPSETNYVAMLGGSNYGITNDAPYWDNMVKAPSLISQLDTAGLHWKAYLQGLPYPGYRGMSYPARINGTPDTGALYDSKHNGIPNFTTSQNAADWAAQVQEGEPSTDLASGNVPTFGYIVPDACHDMHGSPPMCIDSGTTGDPQDSLLVSQGDRYLGDVVAAITGAPFWGSGNNAIFVTFDQGADGDTSGCCDAQPGTGRIATVVVTSRGPRGLQDPTPYNHFSLLQTIQRSFGLPCLKNSCDVSHVSPMAPLLALSGSQPTAFTALPETTPLPPQGVVAQQSAQVSPPKPGSRGLIARTSSQLGGSDNALGAIGGSSGSDIWAVGSYLPDDPKANPDAILTLTNHYDGTAWSSVASPNPGPNFNVLFGVADAAGKAWAVGSYLAPDFSTVDSLIETWDGTAWSVAANPQPGALRNALYGVVAISATDIWAVGDEQGWSGRWTTLAEHWDGKAWAVVPTLDPGPAGDHLYAVAATGPNDVWAVGQELGPTWPDHALVEHWDGNAWSLATPPSTGPGAALLAGVAATPTRVWAVGQTTDGATPTRTLVMKFDSGAWSIPASADTPSSDDTLYAVAEVGGTAYAAGTAYASATDTNHTLAIAGTGRAIRLLPSDDPGGNSGGAQLGGVAAVGQRLWAAGVYNVGDQDLALIEATRQLGP